MKVSLNYFKKIVLKILTPLVLLFCVYSLTSAKDTSNLNVVTTLYPLHFFTQFLSPERVKVISLLNSQDFHHFHPSPKDLIAIQKANLFIMLNHKIENWFSLNSVTQQNKLLELMQEITLETHHYDDHLITHQLHTDKKEHLDPHIWLNPDISIKIINLISTRLISLTPEQSNEIEQKKDTLIQNLNSIYKDYSKKLQNCTNKNALVTHDAFKYIEEYYHFKLYPIVGLSTIEEPSSKWLVHLQKLIKSHNITHILVEENQIEQYAKLMAREGNLSVLPIYSLASPAKDKSLDYFDLLKVNLDSFQKAFDCQ